MKTELISIDEVKRISCCSLAIGFFDGLHLGHQRLIEIGRERPPFGILTFTQDLAHQKSQSMLISQDDKDDLLEHIGVQEQYLLTFDERVRNTGSREFMKFLSETSCERMIVGEDFTFGKDKKGTALDLKRYLERRGIEVVIVPFVSTETGEKISSTLIRDLILRGDITHANEYLGYHYFRSGVVIHGLENGRKIGFPTANLALDDNLVHIAPGVYDTDTIISGRRHRSMTNVGDHPTIDRLETNIIETHIFDFDGDLYSEKITIVFNRKIRDQQRFADLDELKEQLRRDEEMIRRY